MILQICPNSRQVHTDGNAMRAQLLGWTDARQQQQLWGIDRAAAEDDLGLGSHFVLAAITHIGHPGGPGPVEQDLCHLRVDRHREVGPIQHRLQMKASLAEHRQPSWQVTW